MQTYQNDPALKASFLAEIGKHEELDAFLKGTYSTTDKTAFRGCAIGCSIHSLNALQGKPQKGEFADHDRVAADLGWPLWLAYLEDNVFESLPDELSKTWPRRLAEAVPVGAVIDDSVLAKIMVWSLTAERFGVIHATDDAEVKGWITTIAEYITADAAGTCTADQREAAARDAWAAWAAWDARDAWAAWDARDVETRDAFYPALSEYVLSVLKELPTPL